MLAAIAILAAVMAAPVIALFVLFALVANANGMLRKINLEETE